LTRVRGFANLFTSGGNHAADARKDLPVNAAALDAFRQIHEAAQIAPCDWQWIGPHMSQRMFGITRERAEAFAARHGGEARPMGAVLAGDVLEVRYQVRGATFGVYRVTAGGWPELLEGGIATLEAAEARRVELLEGRR
jgi:hypothetical protein